MPAKALERISMPDDGTFFTEFIAKRRPVIITDLFAGQAIRQIRSLVDARREFKDMQLLVQSEYSVSSEMRTDTMTFEEYWRLAESDPSGKLLCTEYEIPAKIMTMFSLPEMCRTRMAKESEELLSFPLKFGDHDLFENVFIANSGNKAHLHYDGDHRQVLLYQVFGRKRVILFQPDRTFKLKPLDGPFFCGSGVHLDRMSETELIAFLDEADGYYGVLEPGEAVYMPALIWHHFDYIDDAMSFNIRFGRNRYGRFLSVDNCHRDELMQNIGALFGDGGFAIESDRDESINLLLEEYRKPVSDISEKVRAMRDLLRKLCNKFCEDVRPEECCPPRREEEQFLRIMKDLSGTFRYAAPDVVSASRPVGIASSTQKSQIESKSLSCGYSQDVLRHILFNRLGKQDISSLTKTEAALFLSYMRSPGAAIS